MFDLEDQPAGTELTIDDEDISDDVEPVKVAPDPGKPSERQISEHRLTHLPYRLWCRWCVLGRGRGMQHRACDKSLVPIIGIDYFFLTSGGLRTRQELEMSNEEVTQAREQGKLAKCLLLRCYASKILFGHVVPRKGLDEDGIVVTMILKDLEWLGHTRVIVKADGEPAIQALARRAIELAKVDLKDLTQVSKEDPAAYDSMSNGGTEVGVGLLRGQFRTIKLCLEQRVDKTIPVDHPFIAWMMEHASLLLNALVKGHDGLTPWMRIRGRAWSRPLIGIGESVLYRHPSKGPLHHPDGNVGALGEEGTFVGYSRTSNTFMVANTTGHVVACRSVTRKHEGDRWCADAMSQIQTMPNDPSTRPATKRVHFADGATDAQPTADASAPAPPRDMRISKKDLDQYGYDSECPQCKQVIQYGKPKPGIRHSPQCRTKLRAAMAQTEFGRERLRADDARLDRSIAERVEASDSADARRASHGGGMMAPAKIWNARPTTPLPRRPRGHAPRSARPKPQHAHQPPEHRHCTAKPKHGEPDMPPHAPPTPCLLSSARRL